MHCTLCCLSKMVLHVYTKGVHRAVSIQVVTNSSKFYFVVILYKIEYLKLKKKFAKKQFI